MVEVEVKFRCPDPAAVAAALARLGAIPAGTADEADHYFNARDRDFAATGEAFRLRRVGEASAFTYKGPKRAGPTKTRTEIELAVEDGADAERLVLALGYRPVAVVRKVRSAYRLARGGLDVTVCLDAVAGIGSFAEVEVVCDEAGVAAAQAVVVGVANDLGLTEPEPRSYLGMVLDAGGRA